MPIVNSVLFPEVPEYHLDFQLRSSRHPQLIFSSQQSIHLLELPKFQMSADDLSDPLDAWCFFLTHGAELDAAQMPKTLQTPMVQRAMEVLDMLSKNDLERERYRARLKWERDQKAFIDEAQAKGEWIGRIQMCEKMLKVPVTPNGELGSLRLEVLQQKANALEKQLGVASE